MSTETPAEPDDQMETTSSTQRRDFIREAVKDMKIKQEEVMQHVAAEMKINALASPAFDGSMLREEQPSDVLSTLGISSLDAIPVHGHEIIKKGMPAKIIEAASLYMNMSKDSLMNHMGIDENTLITLALNQNNLPVHAAETLLQILEIHSMAEDLFATAEGVERWLSSPNAMLEGESPMEAAKTSYGAWNVKNLLMSAKHGGVV